MVGQDCTVDSSCRLVSQDGVVAAEPEQVPSELINRGVPVALGQIKLAPLERRGIMRNGENTLHPWIRERWKLRQELGPPGFDLFRQLGIVIGKVEERRAGREFLALKEQRRVGRKKEQGHHGPVSTGAGKLMGPQPATRVCDLVVILEKRDEFVGRDVETWLTATFPLPRAPLALKEIAVLDCGNQLLGRAAIVGVIGLTASGQRHHGSMVEVVVPEGVESVAALFDGSDEMWMLRLVLVGHNDQSPLCRVAHSTADLGQDVL